MLASIFSSLLIPPEFREAATFALKIGVVLLVAFVAFKMIEARGAHKEAAKIEKVNEHASQKGIAAARKSPTSRVLDPSTRD